MSNSRRVAGSSPALSLCPAHDASMVLHGEGDVLKKVSLHVHFLKLLLPTTCYYLTQGIVSSWKSLFTVSVVLKYSFQVL